MNQGLGRGTPALPPAIVTFLAAGVTFAFLLLPLIALIVKAVPADPFGQLDQPAVRDALQLSLVTTAISLALTVVFGTPTAYLLARRRFRGRALAETLIDLPMVLPPAVAGVALLMAFGRRGVLGDTLDAAGVHIAFSAVAVVMAQLFVAAPFYVRAAHAGFRAVDPELERVSRTLGVSDAGTFFRVTAPIALPALAGGAVMAWARALGEFGATIMFAGNFPGVTQTMPLAIYGAFQTDFDAALALSLLLVIVSFTLLIAFRLLLGQGPLGNGEGRA